MPLEPGFLLVQLLNGLQLAMLLFLLSAGLSLVLGLMNFVNLAHGTLYMLGAYLGVTFAGLTGSFWLALALAPLAVAAIGAAVYAGLLRHLARGDHMIQVLATLGLIFVGFDAVGLVWGKFGLGLAKPAALAGGVSVLGETYPAYRLFVIGLGAAVALGLYVLIERTRMGAIVRAGVDNRTMVACLGIDVGRVFFAVFCVGCALAGLAGVVAAPVFSVYPGMDMPVLVLALVVVALGGAGSLRGAFAGSLLIGIVETLGQVYVPAFASVTMYALMAAVLVVRPQGLFPARHAP